MKDLPQRRARKIEKQYLILGAAHAALQPTVFCTAGCNLVRYGPSKIPSAEVMR